MLKYQLTDIAIVCIRYMTTNQTHENPIIMNPFASLRCYRFVFVFVKMIPFTVDSFSMAVFCSRLHTSIHRGKTERLNEWYPCLQTHRQSTFLLHSSNQNIIMIKHLLCAHSERENEKHKIGTHIRSAHISEKKHIQDIVCEVNGMVNGI